VYELLVMDIPLVDALRQGDDERFAELARKQPHFRPFQRCALDYAFAGITTLDEVLRISGGLERYTEFAAEPAAMAPPG
jgi:MSHA biogenesis protein MshE